MWRVLSDIFISGTCVLVLTGMDNSRDESTDICLSDLLQDNLSYNTKNGKIHVRTYAVLKWASTLSDIFHKLC